MNESDILKIVKYMEECLFEPRLNWSKHWFENRTYSRWAADEILGLILDDPFTPSNVIIKKFIAKMESFSEVAEDTLASLIFSIAKDTAEEILLLFERGK